MTEQIGSGTAKGLAEYLDSLVEKGRASQGAITPLKGTFTKVLKTVDGDQWGNVNVREINVKDYSQRFGNLTLGKYSNDSLRIYESRIKKVVDWYLTFLSNPGWVPTFSRQSKKVASKTRADNSKINKEKSSQEVHNRETSSDERESERHEETKPTQSDGLVAFPFPLTNGKMATLYLPVGLEKNDADRIATFIQTLVVHQR